MHRTHFERHQNIDKFCHYGIRFPSLMFQDHILPNKDCLNLQMFVA